MKIQCIVLTRILSISLQVDLKCEHVEHGDSHVELDLTKNEDQFEYVLFVNVELVKTDISSSKIITQ